MNRVIQALCVAVLLTGCETYLDFRSRDHGTGGAGGTGGGGACAAGTIVACYPGAPDTENVGLCRAGLATCQPDGSYGPCEGAVTPTEENCATAVDEDCDGLAPPCTGQLIWAKRFGGSGIDAPGASVAVDSNGDIIIGGAFQGSVDFGGGPLVSAGASDAFLAKFDSSGQHVWSKRFGDIEDQAVGDVAIDGSNNIVAVGSFHGAVDFGGGPLGSGASRVAYIAKFDSTGSHIWSKRMSGTGSQDTQSVSVASDGSVVCAGTFGGSLDFANDTVTSAGGADYFIATMDSMGNETRVRQYGDPGDQSVDGIRSSNTNPGISVAGYFGGQLNFGGTPLNAVDGDDIFIAHLDDAGDHVWSRGIGSAANQRASDITVDVTGDRVIAGHIYGSVDLGGGALSSAGGADAILAKYDTTGGHVWSRRFGDGANQLGNCVATDSTGNIVYGGAFAGSIDFGGGPMASAGNTDAFLAKLDHNGAHLWSKRFGDTSTQSVIAVAVDPMGAIIVLGAFWESIDLGDGSLESAGYQDIFLAKFEP